MDYGTYATLTRLKRLLEITDTDDDTELLAQLEDASRAIDRHCNRYFYVKSDTRYPASRGGSELWLEGDLLDVTSIKMDEDRDAVYEWTLSATDYMLWPDSEHDYPKVRVDMDTRQSLYYASWPRGRRSVQIIGTWGHGDGRRSVPWDASGNTGTVASTTGTTLTVSAITGFEAGQNILVEAEQMYVTAVGDTTLTVVRGINNTTAATHTDANVSIAAYPSPVENACLIEATRIWKRKDSAYSNRYGNPAFGVVEIHKGLDADASRLLAPFVRGYV